MFRKTCNTNDLNTPFNKIKELPRGNAIIIKKSGVVNFEEVITPKLRKACSFERIYFSRGNDSEINKERKKLGSMLKGPILKSIEGDLQNTVFSYIPNTAETAFYGLLSSRGRTK